MAPANAALVAILFQCLLEVISRHVCAMYTHSYAHNYEFVKEKRKKFLPQRDSNNRPL